MSAGVIISRFCCNFAEVKKIIAIAIFAMTWATALATPIVSLLTALPGSEIYELEGHTGLRIRDEQQGLDIAVSWGVFDFNEPNFVGRFVCGETDYMCMAMPTRFFFDSYAEQGRRVVEQVLELDSLQTARLIELVEQNTNPENRVYRYNYVLDNCATRPLGHIEAAVGRRLLSDTLTDTSFRQEMQRYHADYPWYQFGIDMALGRGIDRHVTRRQTAFAPVNLMEQLEESGIVRETITHGEQTLQSRPTPWLLTPMSFALFVLLISILVSLTKGGRIFDTLMFGLFALAGCLLTFLVFFSSHEATSPNLLLLWLNPFCAFGAVLPWIKSAEKLKKSYFFVNFALLIFLAVLAPVLGRQMNAAFWPLLAADGLRSICHLYRCKKRTN